MPPEGYLDHPDVAHIDWFSANELKRALLLRNTPRYTAIENMTHRQSVLEHSVRVANSASLLAQLLYSKGFDIDPRRALFMGDHHDDPEILTGDIPSPVKRNATGQEKERLETGEKLASMLVENLIAKPRSIPRFFPDIFQELKDQQTLESRVVNFADQWDGLSEAIREVICGDFPEPFVRVIEDYRPVFVNLLETNKEWLARISEIFGENTFAFPDPSSLVPKNLDDLDYNSGDSFIDSITAGNPKTYRLWLRFHKALFRINFLSAIFPGWINKFPKAVLNDIESVKSGTETRTSGLVVPRQLDISNVTFGQSLALDTFSFRIQALEILEYQRRQERQ